MRKKICALILTLCLLCPMVAHAAQQVTFDARVTLFPEAFEEAQREAARDFQTGLSMISWQGELTYDEFWAARLKSRFLLNEHSVITLDARSTSYCVEIASNLLGDETAYLMMEAYLTFAMKPYNFLGIPTQYFAMATSRYAHHGAWKPLLNIIDAYTAGSGNRTVSKQQMLEAVTQIAQYVDGDDQMQAWLMAAFMDVGLNDTVASYLCALPEWVAQNVDESGMTITEDNDKVTWSAGNTTLLSITRSGLDQSVRITLPEYDGMGMNATFSQTATDLSAGVQLYSSDEGTMMEVKASAANLPNKTKGAGETQLSFYVAGSYVTPTTQNAVARWVWSGTDASNVLQLGVDWLNEDRQPKLTLDANLAFAGGDTTQLAFVQEDLRNGTSVFSLYEETLLEFVAKVAKPALKVIAPVYFELPVPFIDVLIRTLIDTGAMDLLFSDIELLTGE